MKCKWHQLNCLVNYHNFYFNCKRILLQNAQKSYRDHYVYVLKCTRNDKKIEYSPAYNFSNMV